MQPIQIHFDCYIEFYLQNFHFYMSYKILKYSLNLNTWSIASRNFKSSFQLTTHFDYTYNKFHAIIRADTSLCWKKPISRKAEENNKKKEESLHFIDSYTEYIPSRYSEKWPVMGSYFKISKAGKVCARGIICKTESGEP